MLRPYIDVDRHTFLLTCFFVNPCVEIQQWFLLLVKDVSVEKTNQNTSLAAVRRKRKKASWQLRERSEKQTTNIIAE